MWIVRLGYIPQHSLRPSLLSRSFVNSLQSQGGFSSISCFFVFMFHVSDFTFFVFQVSMSSCDSMCFWLWFSGSPCDAFSNSWSTSPSFETSPNFFQIYVLKPKPSSKVAFESTSEFPSSSTFSSLGLKTNSTKKNFQKCHLFAFYLVSISSRLRVILCVWVNFVINFVFISCQSTLRLWIVVAMQETHITLFISITMFCETECGEYYVKNWQSHITILWIWILLCKCMSKVLKKRPKQR